MPNQPAEKVHALRHDKEVDDPDVADLTDALITVFPFFIYLFIFIKGTISIIQK